LWQKEDFKQIRSRESLTEKAAVIEKMISVKENGRELMHATRKAILTDARNGLLGNRFEQGMEQIPDARNLHRGCTQPI